MVNIGMVEVHFGGSGKKGEVSILHIVGLVQKVNMDHVVDWGDK